MLSDIGLCTTCSKRSTIIDGQIYCTIDRRRIHDHAEEDLCPLGRFGTIGTLPPAGTPPATMPAVEAGGGGCCGK